MKNSLRIEIGLLILRISPAVMLLTHGIPKFKKIIGGGEIEFGDPIGIGVVPSLFLAVVGEFVCPILIIIRIQSTICCYSFGNNYGSSRIYNSFI